MFARCFKSFTGFFGSAQTCTTCAAPRQDLKDDMDTCLACHTIAGLPIDEEDTILSLSLTDRRDSIPCYQSYEGTSDNPPKLYEGTSDSPLFNSPGAFITSRALFAAWLTWHA